MWQAQFRDIPSCSRLHGVRCSDVMCYSWGNVLQVFKTWRWMCPGGLPVSLFFFASVRLQQTYRVQTAAATATHDVLTATTRHCVVLHARDVTGRMCTEQSHCSEQLCRRLPVLTVHRLRDNSRLGSAALGGTSSSGLPFRLQWLAMQTLNLACQYWERSSSREMLKTAAGGDACSCSKCFIQIATKTLNLNLTANSFWLSSSQAII